MIINLCCRLIWLYGLIGPHLVDWLNGSLTSQLTNILTSWWPEPWIHSMLRFPWSPKKQLRSAGSYCRQSSNIHQYKPSFSPPKPRVGVCKETSKDRSFSDKLLQSSETATQPPSASTLCCCCCYFRSYSSCFSICVCEVNVWEFQFLCTSRTTAFFRKTVIKSYEEKL